MTSTFQKSYFIKVTWQLDPCIIFFSKNNFLSLISAYLNAISIFPNSGVSLLSRYCILNCLSRLAWLVYNFALTRLFVFFKVLTYKPRLFSLVLLVEVLLKKERVLANSNAPGEGGGGLSKHMVIKFYQSKFWFWFYQF